MFQCGTYSRRYYHIEERPSDEFGNLMRMDAPPIALLVIARNIFIPIGEYRRNTKKKTKEAGEPFETDRGVSQKHERRQKKQDNRNENYSDSFTIRPSYIQRSKAELSLKDF